MGEGIDGPLIQLFNQDELDFDVVKSSIPNDFRIVEDDKVFMVYCKLRSTAHIFTKKNCKLITSFPQISYLNTSATTYLRERPKIWDELTVTQSFEGPMILVFYYGSRWYTTSEVSLQCNNVYGNSTKPLKDYFMDTGKCDTTKLDKSLCYYFVLLHHKLRHIVQYTTLGCDYKELALVSIMRNLVAPPTSADTDANTNTNTDTDVEKCMDPFADCGENPFIKPTIYHFSCLDELEATLEKITYDNATYRRVSMEGFILQHIGGKLRFKIQSELYQQIDKLKPLERNNYQVYLELYQQDKLGDILPYVSKYSNEIVHRINMSMRTLSREILNIYHTTRKRRNCELYDSLSDNYKKVLYGIHGLYIRSRRKDFVNGREIEGKDIRSITVHDIYYHIKNLQPEQLRLLYADRTDLMKNPLIIPHMNLSCIYTMTQTKLMEG